MAGQRLEDPSRHCEQEDTSSITNDAKTRVDPAEHAYPDAVEPAAADGEEDSAPELEQQDAYVISQSDEHELTMKDEFAERVDEQRDQTTQDNETNAVTEQDLASLRQDAKQSALVAAERLLDAEAPEHKRTRRLNIRDFQASWERFFPRLTSEDAEPKPNHKITAITHQLCSLFVLIWGLAIFIGLAMYSAVLQELDRLFLHYIFESIVSIQRSRPSTSISLSQLFIPSSEVDYDCNAFARGRYSSLLRGTWHGSSVVVKTAPIATHENRPAFLNEVATWHKLQYPHIVRLLGACDDKIPLFVCELTSTETLLKYVSRKSRAEMWAKLYETALGLQYLHMKHGVVHGDLRCANILLGKDSKAKLTGFGSSFKFKADVPYATEVGDIDWHWAPEIIHGVGCKSFASDVYSLGVCVLEAVMNQMHVRQVKTKRDLVKMKDQLERPDKMNDKHWSLVSQMCAWLPSDRPDITTVASSLKCIFDEERQAESKAKLQQQYRIPTDRQPKEAPGWFICEDQVTFATIAFKYGGFGSIHHGTYGGAEVVVKCLLEDCTYSRKGMKSFMNEAKVWYKLNHPHVIRLYGACDISNPPFYVCESAVKYGNLDDYLCFHDEQLTTVWRLFHQAAMGLLYLHQQGIVHGDLKCNNILVSDNKTAKLSDFGLSIIRMESKTMSKQVQTGATQWVAPECLSGAVEIPTYASDVYSFGMCIIEAFKRTSPWGRAHDLGVMESVAEGRLPHRPVDISDEGWALVEKMAAADPSARISVQDVVDLLDVLAENEKYEEEDKIPMCRDMDCNTLNATGSKFCTKCGKPL